MMISSVTRAPMSTPLRSSAATGAAGSDFAAALSGASKTGSPVEVVTASDGTKWTKTDIAAALTDQDKSVLGWPSSDPTTIMLSAMVASDRTDGSLTGPMTRDYILGNRDRNIPGLVDRQPTGVMDKQRIEGMIASLSGIPRYA